MAIDFSLKIPLFPIFCQTWHGPTDRRKDGRTDGRTNPLIEMPVASKKTNDLRFLINKFQPAESEFWC